MPQKTDTLGGVVSNPEGHTPGPWQYAAALKWDDDALIQTRSVQDADGNNVILTEANAYLITAAPDLLDALEAFFAKVDGWHECVRDIHDMVDLHAKARTAIAKARGLHPHTQEGVK